MKTSLISVVFTLLVSVPCMARADQLATQAAALDVIGTFVNKFCTEIPLKGESSAAEISGKVSAELLGLLKKLNALGADVRGTYQSKQFQGLLQSDLLKALENNTACKMKLWDDLREKLLPNASVEQPRVMFPAVVAALSDGRFGDVPDDRYFRSYIVSFYQGMYDVCEPNGNGIGVAAALYGFPQARAFIHPDPYQMIGRFLKDLAAVQQSAGSLSSLMAMSADTPAFFGPGREDGVAYANAYKCDSQAIHRLRMRTGNLIDSRQGEPAEPPDNQRWAALMTPEYRELVGNRAPAIQVTRAQLHQACLEQIRGLSLDRDKEHWCECAVRIIVGGGVGRSLQNEMLEDFEWALDSAKKDNPQFERSLYQCAV